MTSTISNQSSSLSIDVAGDYYRDHLSEVAHYMKDRSNGYTVAALMMEPLVTPDMVLVPVPGHDGRPGMASRLAYELARLTGIRVADVLRCSPHPSSYDCKKSGLVLQTSDLHFFLTGRLPEGFRPVLIDNVIASGTTILTAMKTTGITHAIALADDPGARGRLPELRQAARDMWARRSRIGNISVNHRPDGTRVIRCTVDGRTQTARPLPDRMGGFWLVAEKSRFQHMVEHRMAERLFGDLLQARSRSLGR